MVAKLQEIVIAYFQFCSFTVTSIDLTTKLKWPAHAVKYTSTKPSLSYSSEPSFYSHNINLSKEQEKRRKDLFVICDLLDEMIDYVGCREKKGRSKKKSKRKSKAKNEAGSSGLSVPSKKKKKKSKKDRKPRLSSESHGTENLSQAVEASSSGLANKPIASSKEVETTAKEVEPAFSTLANGDNIKVEKQVKRLKRMKKKLMSGTSEHPTGPSPIKKSKSASAQEVKHEETNQQKIKIAFSQNSGKLSAKSKWDTSSDEEVTSRKGAISYRFSDESDTQVARKKMNESVVPKQKLKQTTFGKMQPGGILQTIEIHNPLPDMKPAVPLAHPNPGPDVVAKSVSRSRSRSRSSRSRSRSRSYSYSTDGSYHRRRRRGGKRSRRSYSRSISRSRSRSYSSSRSRSRSYSRSHSRSSSRSRSRYRSYSRSSYSSYSSRSYSSRSRTRSPRYTRAVQPKYNNTRAYNLGKRKKFNKKKNQFKNQQNQQHQNPAILKVLETGRMKAEETVMRLKKQKEEQEDLKKRTMESIAKAASSAGIPLPTTTAAASSSTSANSSTATGTKAQANNIGELLSVTCINLLLCRDTTISCIAFCALDLTILTVALYLVLFINFIFSYIYSRC